MIVSPFNFMFGIVFCVAGVGSFLLMLFTGGLADTSIVLLCLAILMAGIVLGAGSIEPPKQSSRIPFGNETSERTRKNLEKAIQQSLDKNVKE